MSAKICSECEEKNNPSFNNCWKCGKKLLAVLESAAQLSTQVVECKNCGNTNPPLRERCDTCNCYIQKWPSQMSLKEKQQLQRFPKSAVGLRNISSTRNLPDSPLIIAVIVFVLVVIGGWLFGVVFGDMTTSEYVNKVGYYSENPTEMPVAQSFKKTINRIFN